MSSSSFRARPPNFERPAAARRWGALPIALHWLIALIIAALIVIGWRMVHGGIDAAATFDAYQLHKSLGFLALALTVARLAARVRFASPPKPQAPRWERRLASFTQGALIVLTIGASLAGWLVVSASPLPIPTRVFNLFVIPNIARPDAALFAAATLAHQGRRLGHRRSRRAARRGCAQAPSRRSRRRAQAHAAAVGEGRGRPAPSCVPQE